MPESKSGALPTWLYPQNKKWGGRRDSNPRQPEPQSGALPTELHPPKYLIMVRQQGFEPRAHGLEGRCSIQLSYWRIYGAGEGNRTLVTGLEGQGSTTELHPQLRSQYLSAENEINYTTIFICCQHFFQKSFNFLILFNTIFF